MDDETRAYFEDLRHELNSRFDGVDTRFDAVEAGITSEVATARRELGVLIERVRENMGFQLAELRVAIADLRVRR